MDRSRTPVARRPRLPRPSLAAASLVVAILLLAVPILGVGRDVRVARTGDEPATPESFAVRNVGFGTLLRLPEHPWLFTGPEDDAGRFRASVTSGAAAVSVWIYRRGRRGPRSAPELQAARTRLLRAARTRDATFRAVRTAIRRYDGLPAIEIRGSETILGRPRTVRSVHVYVGGREIVIDAYAPDGDFRAVDRSVFRPILESLRVAPDWRRVRGPDRAKTA